MTLAVADQITLDRLLRDAVNDKKLDMVKLCIAKGSNPAMEENGAQFLLFNAYRSFNKDIFDELLANGVCIDAPNYDGKSCLYQAVYDKNVTVAKYLLDNGADPLFKSPKQGVSTPLEAARCISDYEYGTVRTSLIDMLLKAMPDQKESLDADSLSNAFKIATDAPIAVPKLTFKKTKPDENKNGKNGGFTI